MSGSVCYEVRGPVPYSQRDCPETPSYGDSSRRGGLVRVRPPRRGFHNERVSISHQPSAGSSDFGTTRRGKMLSTRRFLGSSRPILLVWFLKPVSFSRRLRSSC